MLPTTLFGLTALAYLASALVFWRLQWRPATGPERPVSFAVRLIVAVPLALHGWLLLAGIFGEPTLRFGFGQALSVMLWLAVAIYWIESLYVRMDGLHVIVLPIAAICAGLPLVFPGFSAQAHAGTVAFRAHLVLGMGAYSLFTIAALQALLMAVLERRLHSGAVAAPFASLPPLLTLERVLFRLIGAGFVLLTATLATGFLFSEQVFGRAMRIDHKTMFAIASWFVFLGLLVGRWRHGWRGRTAIRWILAGFAMLLLAYIGSRFVLEVILQRGEV